MLYSIGYIGLFIASIIDIFKGVVEIFQILIDKQPLYSKVIMSIFVLTITGFSILMRAIFCGYILEKYISKI